MPERVSEGGGEIEDVESERDGDCVAVVVAAVAVCDAIVVWDIDLAGDARRDQVALRVELREGERL